MRVAILGAQGIGRHHARIFRDLGAEIASVLGSSEQSVAAATAALERDFGIRTKGVTTLDALWNERIDAVSVCTPPELHFEQIMAALDHGAAVFCEKPFFWRRNIMRPEIEESLSKIGGHPHRRIVVNTANETFIDAVTDLLPPPTDIEHFVFRFHTLGGNRARDIGLDLLPHGFSLVLRLLGTSDIGKINETVGDLDYTTSFRYGHCLVQFEFHEDPAGERLLEFEINDLSFRRLQQGMGDTYAVSIQADNSGETRTVDDPFQILIGRFMSLCGGHPENAVDGFDSAALNLRLMAHVLLGSADGAPSGNDRSDETR